MFSIACCFQLRPFKKNWKSGQEGGGFLSLEIRVGGGSSGLGNSVRKGGQKCLPSIGGGGGCIFYGITHSFYLNAYLGSLEPQTFGFPLDSCPDALPVSHADLDSSSTTSLITICCGLIFCFGFF